MKPRDSFPAAILAIVSVLAVGVAGSNINTSPTATTSGQYGVPRSTPALAAPKNIAGSYDATGTNENGGGTYRASLVVTAHDDVYQFSWASGSNVYDGVGVLLDNAVAVSFTAGSSGKGCGVVLYRIKADGSLDGRAGYWGVNVSEKERAKRTSGIDLAGEFEVMGTNTAGKDYKGTLDVKTDGPGYAFVWNAGTVLEGFGIKTGDKVAVGFGGKQCAFVSYEVKPDGTLDGRWGSQGSRSFGTEVAKRK